MKLFFFIGMPGAGKTFWGKKITDHYSLNFIDLDEYIEMCASSKIEAIFRQSGEDAFRKYEHESLKKIIETTEQDTIIACGGGTPCYYGNMELMKHAGIVIYLETTITNLINNLQLSIGIRPLLDQQTDILLYLDELLKKRRPVYEQAHVNLQAEASVLEQFKSILDSCTNPHL